MAYGHVALRGVPRRWGRQGGIEVKHHKNQGRPRKWSSLPSPWVHPSCGQRQPGIYISLPQEISTAETSGKVALQPQIQQQRQAGNARLHFLPEDTFYPLQYEMHIEKLPPYIETFLLHMWCFGNYLVRGDSLFLTPPLAPSPNPGPDTQ